MENKIKDQINKTLEFQRKREERNFLMDSQRPIEKEVLKIIDLTIQKTTKEIEGDLVLIIIHLTNYMEEEGLDVTCNLNYILEEIKELKKKWNLK